jgi:hypothetical protein
MDSHLQRIVDDAEAEHGDLDDKGFYFPPATSRLEQFRFLPASRTNSDMTMFNDPGKCP